MRDLTYQSIEACIGESLLKGIDCLTWQPTATSAREACDVIVHYTDIDTTTLPAIDQGMYQLALYALDSGLVTQAESESLIAEANFVLAQVKALAYSQAQAKVQRMRQARPASSIRKHSGFILL